MNMDILKFNMLYKGGGIKMDIPEGFKITGNEKDKIIMEKTFGENGRIVFVANPSPDSDKKQQVINEAGKILLKNTQKQF